MSDELPMWAKERAFELLRAEAHGDLWVLGDRETVLASPGNTAFARYIASKEKAPVDPLLIEAREIAASERDYQGRCGSRNVRDGFCDKDDDVNLALAALKRGIELAAKQ